MAVSGFLILFVISACFVQFSTTTNQNICLYSGPLRTILRPLQLFNTDCPTNTSFCMCSIYKYGNFQYNGIAALKPHLGEVVAFLTQSQDGDIDFVAMLNANTDITSQVTLDITGAEPVGILLEDDPDNGGPKTDHWNWTTSNVGNFSWTTQPTFTDGVVIGHINFIDNYCVTSTYTQAKGAINTTTVLSGSTANVTRVISVPYTPGAAFTFCQFPVTNTTYVNATCPGSADGKATLNIIFGPATVMYSWFDSNDMPIGSTATVTGLAAGTYSVELNDTTPDGCNAMRFVTIYDHTLFGAFVATTQFACTTKGSASATPNGGASDFSYSWFVAGSTTPFATGTSVTGLNIGNYYVQVTDSCGSVAKTNFTITTAGCCGDGTCQSTETCASCPSDCGVCCPPGTITNGATCTVCPPGSRNNAPESTSCTPCPANTFNSGGNDTCAPCPVNYASAAGSGVCTRCPTGAVRASSATSCTACTAGTYTPCDDSPCTPCAAGTFSSMSGTVFCSTCAPGTWSAAGASSCPMCAANQYASSGASSCTDCPAGTSAVAGSANILACM